MSKITEFNLPHMHLVPPIWGDPKWFSSRSLATENQSPGLSCSIVCIILLLAVLTQYGHVKDKWTDRQTDKPYGHEASRRRSGTAAAIISLWRHRHPISVGGDDAQQQPEAASAQRGLGYAARCSAHAAAAASALLWPEICIFFHFKTLLLLQFLIEFGNIWVQYCPSTYASTHVGFFWFVP